ncbi:hypothetical protein [Paraliomyxa miuraensis]|uniref:hypothetical protein n=1 Tax=Paraliomyxa miuraensis TaxID=376150 RepID=UPI0022570F74|nr:hypothetical protein [Paraliomyxa miuraensis]MCX4239361.1 hypothetical protein [Paraliomyxa miuraensis]
MRLPLRHPPPDRDPPPRRCAHLDALAAAAVGLPLGPAADLVAPGRSRGRHGNALQWHLGLASHDAEAKLDWEDRIEIKLVSVWLRAGAVVCDKLKVSDIAVDPWHKLSNVLWVFADRLTRVVVGTRAWGLRGGVRARLARSWSLDPHFDQPDLFVEARERADGSAAPSYYLSARWLGSEGLLPAPGPGIFSFDARWWGQSRAEHGRDPLPSVAVSPHGQQRCGRCGGPLRFDPEAVVADGWAPAHHGMPLGPACAPRGHFVVDGHRLLLPPELPAEDMLDALERRIAPDAVWRLSERVIEPDDHLHEPTP